MKYIRIQLIRKLAHRFNGVDLTPYTVGETIELSEQAAAILLSEGWAVTVEAVSPLQGTRAAPASPRRRAHG
jgi:hypothetical protein